MDNDLTGATYSIGCTGFTQYVFHVFDGYFEAHILPSSTSRQFDQREV